MEIPSTIGKFPQKKGDITCMLDMKMFSENKNIAMETGYCILIMKELLTHVGLVAKIMCF